MHYLSFNDAMRARFGTKVYRLSLQSGCTCPNRDGTIGTGGCTFCSEGGSGDFAAPFMPIEKQIKEARKRVDTKIPASIAPEDRRYIAYFQSYTNTYGNVDRLRALYTKAISHPQIVALDIGTRPDCLPPEMVEMLQNLQLSSGKPVWVELGLQTIHELTALTIRRGYPLKVYDDAVRRLQAAGITVIVHMIIGLPGETPEMIRQTAAYIGRSGVQGIKFQLLHVLEGTDLAEEYRAGALEVLSLDTYIRILEECIESIPPEMVVHRLTGDGAKRSLIAPRWSADKKRVLNEINRAFERDRIRQGKRN